MKWLKETLGNFFGTIAAVFIGIYLIGATISVPYYNWQYVRNNGVIDWIILGEIAATAKAMFWPYYVFFDKPNVSADENPPPREDAPKLTVDEIDAMSKLNAKSRTEELTEADINVYKGIFRGYYERTGTKIQQSDIDNIIKLMGIMAEYDYELNQSALQSWDNHSPFTTNAFDKILKVVKDKGIRKPELLDIDKRALAAAANNQTYLEDGEGNKYQFGRELILNNLRENEIARNNFEKIIQVFNAIKRE